MNPPPPLNSNRFQAQPTQEALDGLGQSSWVLISGLDQQLLPADIADDFLTNAAAQNRAEFEESCFRQGFEASFNSYLMTTIDGTIQKANFAATQLFHAPYGDALVNIPLIVLISKSSRRDFFTQLLSLKRKEQAQKLALGLRRWDKSLLYAVTSIYPIRTSQDGQPELLWLFQAKGALAPGLLENKLEALSRGCLV